MRGFIMIQSRTIPARIRPALAHVWITRVSVTALILLTLPGCIVRDIRDEMVTSNQSIADTNRLLQGIREDVDRTNEILSSLEGRLDRQFEQLQRLESVDGSLTAIDAHLASLRKTLENIDSTIPLLSFADSSEDEATTQPETPPATSPASPSTAAASQPAKNPLP
jgi:hypothetical protein